MKRLKHPRYILFVAVAVLAFPFLRTAMPLAETVVAAFDAGVAAFVLSCVPLWRHGGQDHLREQAQRDDAGAVLLLFLTAVISAVILAAITQLALEKDVLALGDIVLLVGTLLASWIFANLIYAMHYARLYYAPNGSGQTGDGGLDFPGDEPPCFADFVNFAFVIGMTCQTADIAITRSGVRRVATFQGLFAFVFNLGVLALTVNVLAS